MVMDLISGIVVITSTFLVALALTALFTGLASKEIVKTGKDGGIGNVDVLEWLVYSRVRLIFASLFVVYAVAMTDVFVIAQQPTLAFLNLVAGIALVAVHLFAVAPRKVGKKVADESGREDWNR